MGAIFHGSTRSQMLTHSFLWKFFAGLFLSSINLSFLMSEKRAEAFLSLTIKMMAFLCIQDSTKKYYCTMPQFEMKKYTHILFKRRFRFEFRFDNIQYVFTLGQALSHHLQFQNNLIFTLTSMFNSVDASPIFFSQALHIYAIALFCEQKEMSAKSDH